MSVTIPTITLAGAVANLTRATVAGTAGTGVTAVEQQSGQQQVTKLTLSAFTIAAIAAGAAEAIGKLIYTLPAGAILVRAAYIDVGLEGTDALIDADTPDIGVGTLIGTGAVATLDLVDAAAEDILSGQLAANCTGTHTDKGVTDQGLVIKAGDSHAVHLNVADTWAGADAGLIANGTIVLEWINLS